MLADFIPAWHPNVDGLLAAKTPLPANHPPLEPYVCRTGPEECAATVSEGHVDLESSINDVNMAFPGSHPSVSASVCVFASVCVCVR